MDDEAFRRLGRERDLYRGLLSLHATVEIKGFLEQSLRLIVDAIQAEQGYLELFERSDSPDECAWWTAAGCSDEEVKEIRAVVSRGIIAEALETGEVLITPSAILDPRFRDRGSVRRSNINAVLCAPVGRGPAVGVLYLQRRSLTRMFSEADKGCAEIFAQHLAPLAHALSERRRSDDARDPTLPFRQRMKLDQVVGSSPALAGLLREIELVAPLDVSILLAGETGSGKTQIARVIHANSRRSDGPFVEINCATLPEMLMESELFGALPGAHSTASRKVEGKVPAAKGGTLLLDEIAELSVTAQAKLLQLLQTQEYYPLGAARPLAADVRVIAATNVELEKAVAAKRFREDLFFRLHVLPIRVPSLNERRQDIPALARYFSEKATRAHRLRTIELSSGAIRVLRESDWPGNIRQLSHLVEAATIRAVADESPEIEATHFGSVRAGTPKSDPEGCTFHDGTRRYQRELLRNTLQAAGGNVSEAARRLDLTRAHVYTLLKTFGLDRD